MKNVTIHPINKKLHFEIDTTKDTYFFPYAIVSGNTTLDEKLRFNSLNSRIIFTGRRSLIIKPFGWDDQINNHVLIKPTDENTEFTLKNLSNNINTDQSLTEEEKLNLVGTKKLTTGLYTVGRLKTPFTHRSILVSNDLYTEEVNETIISAIFKDTGQFLSLFWDSDTHTYKRDFGALLWTCPELNKTDILKIDQIDIFVNEDNEYVYHEIKFVSLGDKLKQVGLTLEQTIQFSSPGEDFIFPQVIQAQTTEAVKRDENGDPVLQENLRPVVETITTPKHIPKTNEELEGLIVKVEGVKKIQIEFDGVVGLLSVNTLGRKKQYVNGKEILNKINNLWYEKLEEPIPTSLSKNLQFETDHVVSPINVFTLENFTKDWKAELGMNWNPNDVRDNRGSLYVPTPVWEVEGFDKVLDKNFSDIISETGNSLINFALIPPFVNFDRFISSAKTIFSTVKSSFDSFFNIFRTPFNQESLTNAVEEPWKTITQNKKVSIKDVDNTLRGITTNPGFGYKGLKLTPLYTLALLSAFDISTINIQDNTFEYDELLTFKNHHGLVDFFNYNQYITYDLWYLNPKIIIKKNYKDLISTFIKVGFTLGGTVIGALSTGGTGAAIGTFIGSSISNAVDSIFSLSIPADIFNDIQLLTGGDKPFSMLLSLNSYAMMYANIPGGKLEKIGIPLFLFTTEDNPASSIIDTSQMPEAFKLVLTDELSDDINTVDLVNKTKTITIKNDDPITGLKNQNSFIIDALIVKAIGKRTMIITFYDRQDNVVFYQHIENNALFSNNMRQISTVLNFNYNNESFSNIEGYYGEPKLKEIKTVNKASKQDQIIIEQGLLLSQNNLFLNLQNEIIKKWEDSGELETIKAKIDNLKEDDLLETQKKEVLAIWNDFLIKRQRNLFNLLLKTIDEKFESKTYLTQLKNGFDDNGQKLYTELELTNLQQQELANEIDLWLDIINQEELINLQATEAEKEALRSLLTKYNNAIFKGTDKDELIKLETELENEDAIPQNVKDDLAEKLLNRIIYLYDLFVESILTFFDENDVSLLKKNNIELTNLNKILENYYDILLESKTKQTTSDFNKLTLIDAAYTTLRSNFSIAQNNAARWINTINEISIKYYSQEKKTIAINQINTGLNINEATETVAVYTEKWRVKFVETLANEIDAKIREEATALKAENDTINRIFFDDVFIIAGINVNEFNSEFKGRNELVASGTSGSTSFYETNLPYKSEVDSIIKQNEDGTYKIDRQFVFGPWRKGDDYSTYTSSYYNLFYKTTSNISFSNDGIPGVSTNSYEDSILNGWSDFFLIVPFKLPDRWKNYDINRVKFPKYSYNLRFKIRMNGEIIVIYKHVVESAPLTTTTSTLPATITRRGGVDIGFETSTYWFNEDKEPNNVLYKKNIDSTGKYVYLTIYNLEVVKNTSLSYNPKYEWEYIDCTVQDFEIER